MSNLSPEHSFQPLSVGNVVSAAVRLYRSNLKRYLILVLRSILWSFVPIYGWAKSIEIAGRISRLAYQELIDQPETLTEAYQKTKPQIWNFLLAGFLMGLIQIGLAIAFLIVNLILNVLAALLFSAIGSARATDSIGAVLGILIALAFLGFILAAFFVWLRVFSRLFIYEVPLAIEDRLDGSSTIGRSWTLTKGSVGRIQIIILVAGLITSVILSPASFLLVAFITAIFSQSGDIATANDSIANAIIVLFYGFYAAILLGNALILPFWQAIKAVVYYDLRSRREGLGLNLRDRG